jgi:hypothetical protein
MATQGPLNAGTAADDTSVGTVAWTTPDNGKATDGIFTTFVGASATSHYLKLTNFGFTIPSGATINGITASVLRKASGANVTKDSNLKLVNSAGTIGGTDKADTSTFYPTSLTAASYGSSSDLWGAAWTSADINNSNFGIALSAVNASCFVAGTLIKTPNGDKPIEDIRPGDAVLCFDPVTRKVEASQVTKLQKLSRSIVISDIRAGGTKVSCTPRHLMYTQRGFVRAFLLKKTDVLFVERDGEMVAAPIDSITYRLSRENVYDFAVAEHPTYFADGIAVHNFGTSTTVSVDSITITVDYTPGIAFDAASNSGDQAASANYTFARTVTGSNTFLAVDVELLTLTGATVTSVTDDDGGGNNAMVLLGARSTVTGAGRVECWGLAAPATGTKNIRVILSSSIESAATAVSYTGVHQTFSTEGFNSNQATNSGSATDASVAITSVADNCWIHAACVANDTSITANQTSRNNISGTLGSGANEDNNTAVSPAGSTTMSYTGMGITATWAIAGYAIRPTAASGLSTAVASSLLMLMGVGT